MTPEQIFAAFTEQIFTCRDQAHRAGVMHPEIRSVITYRSQRTFLQAEAFQHTYSTLTASPAKSCDFQFQNSFVTVIPGDDHFFQTRCTNLPPP